MKLFYNSDGTVKVLPVSALPANTVWNGGFPYTPEGSLLVSIVSAKPTDTVSNGGFIQELWGGVCAGYDTPSIWIGGLAITSYGALCLDVDGGIVTDGPVLNLPLTHTAIPTRGDITPSFTRATTATGQKWDEAGYLDFTALAGEVVFKGARRVRNKFTFTEDLTNAAYTAIRLTKTNSTTLTETAVLGTHAVVQNGADTYVAGNTYVLSCKVKFTGRSGWIAFGSGNAGSSAACIRTFNPALGTFGSFTTDVGMTFVSKGIDAVDSNGFARISITFIPTGTTAGGGFQLYTDASTDGSGTISFTGDVDVSIQCKEFQLEDVTGQTTQTAGEYVSVGVESAPAYHGSMVDGVKCYDTDRSGNPISTSGSYPLVGYVPWEARTNLCLQSNAFTTTPWADQVGTCTPTQSAIGPDGATSAWMLTDNDGANAEVYGANVGTLTAAIYTASIFVAKTSGAQNSYPVVLMYDGTALRLSAATIDTTNGIATVWTSYTGWTAVGTASCVSHNADFWRVSLTFTASTNAWVINLVPAGTLTATLAGPGYDVTAQGSAVFYGAQLELGSFATPYIPTTTVAVARNADVDQYPTTAGPIAAAGSIALDFTPYHPPSGTIALWGTYVDASNYTAILHDATNLIFRKRIAGSNYDATIANAFVSGTTCKIAATWGAAGTAIYLDGVAGTPHANTTAAQIAATMQVGADGNSLQQPGAGTTNLRIWQRQLSAPEGVAVTS